MTGGKVALEAKKSPFPFFSGFSKGHRELRFFKTVLVQTLVLSSAVTPAFTPSAVCFRDVKLIIKQ